MRLTYDPEFLVALERLSLGGPTLRPAVHDIQARRDQALALTSLLAHLPEDPQVTRDIHYVTTPDCQIPLYAFSKKQHPSSDKSKAGPAILHTHGGGMIAGSVEAFDKSLRFQISRLEIPIFSVGYRLAPESRGTALVEDCYAALLWLHQNASNFNIDTARIAVMGESAGGGITAGLALMARDRDLQPPLAKQILVSPMLDDRNIRPDKDLEPFVSWDWNDNLTGWTALLGDKAGKEDSAVSYYAAPARAPSVASLPPAYLEVGDLDIFRDENITYATRLMAENINTELHVYPGVQHAFTLLAPSAGVTQRAMANKFAAMTSF